MTPPYGAFQGSPFMAPRHLRCAARAALCATFVLAGAGCSTNLLQDRVGTARGAHHMETPVGIDPSPNGMRASPCACIELTVDETGRITL